MTLDQQRGARRVAGDRQVPTAHQGQRAGQVWHPEGGWTDVETDPHSIVGRLERIGQAVSTFWGPVVILDMVLGFSLLWVVYLFPAGMPGGILTGAAMILIGAFRRPQLRTSGGGLLMIAALCVLAFVVLETMHNDMPWGQRTLKFVILLGAAGTLATGRINIRSLVIGGCCGAAINVPLFYAGLTTNSYPPFLTGFYGDKNIAGMYYAVWGVLGIMVLSRKWAVLWVLFAGTAMFLTGSRTSIAALVCAWAWVLLRNRVGITYRIVYTILGFGLLTYALDHWAKNNAFGNRTGDDWYREQIMRAMDAKVAVTPWYGQGLNSGFVMLGPRQQWFHDSYQQAFVEGGYVLLWALLIAFIVLGLGLFDRRVRISHELLVSEAAVIVVLICAWKLGEVFITMGAFLILGMCVAYRLGKPNDANPYDWSTHASRILGEADEPREY